MRVTDSIREQSVRKAQQRAAEQVMERTETAVSGFRVRKPKDDPSSFASITVKEASLARLADRKRSLVARTDDLSLAEGALAQAGGIMQRARDLAVQMADGSMGPSERALAAKEVAQLRQALVGLANARGTSGYLFAGSNVETAPFDAAGVFGGNDASVAVEVADGLFVRGNASGAMAFTAAGGRDVFAELQAFETALTANDSAGIQAGINAMTESHAQVVRARSEAGLTMDRFRMSVEVTENAAVALSRVKASESEADLATAYSELTSASSAYERVLEITRRTLGSVDLSKFP